MKLDIDSPYSLSEEQKAFFRANGFIKIKDVLSPHVLDYYGAEITRKVFELNTNTRPMSERTTYQKAFIQIVNLWLKSEVVKDFVFGQRLARLAAELMGVAGVRLYHDQALYKEAGGGLTPWHADQFYWPLASDACCTVWIPLQATPLEMGPMAFAAGSHHFTFGRDLNISDESEAQIQAALAREHFSQVHEPFDLGEVSFHYGWTFHRASPNTTATPRKVMTIIYMDAEMRLKAPENRFQEIDREVFCPGVAVGENIATPMNPLLYQQN